MAPRFSPIQFRLRLFRLFLKSKRWQVRVHCFFINAKVILVHKKNGVLVDLNMVLAPGVDKFLLTVFFLGVFWHLLLLLLLTSEQLRCLVRAPLNRFMPLWLLKRLSKSFFRLRVLTDQSFILRADSLFDVH